MKFLKKESKKLLLENIYKQELVNHVSEENINGLQVVKYVDGGLCSYPTFVVFGEKYNFSFSPICGLDIEREFAQLREVVESVELIK